MMIKYTKEQKQFLIDNNYLTPAQELADMFNKKFGTNITKTNIKNFRGNNHLSSGLTGQFEKGHKPHNKGKKWDEYMSKEGQANSRKTTFKKGNIPKQHRPVGSERINIDGYIEIKVKEPNKWDLKHRVIYRQKYGEIPKGYNVIFLDGNKENLDISNLKVISKHDNLIMNENNLRFNDKELTESAYLIAQIEKKRRSLKNERL
jgi:hypothetical protein